MGRKKKLSPSGEKRRQERIQDRLRAVDGKKQKKADDAAAIAAAKPKPEPVQETENAPAPDPVREPASAPVPEPEKPARRSRRSYAQPQGRYMGPKQLSIGEPGEDGLRPVGMPPRATVRTLFDAIRKDGFDSDCDVYIRLDAEPVRESGCHMAYRCLHGVFTRMPVPAPPEEKARREKTALCDILESQVRRLYLAEICGRNVWMANIPVEDYGNDE